MSLTAVFKSTEKGVNLEKFPKPPTLREMMEDIEACTSDDAVIRFAEVLQKKGTGQDAEDTESSKTVLQDTNSTGVWLLDSLAVAAMREINMKPQYSLKSPASPSMSKDHGSPATTVSSDLHTKIKQFSTICNKSEELISKIEGSLRDIESGCQEILQDFSIEDSLT